MKARLTVDKAYKLSPIDDRLYGSFIEHMGRAIYTGIYEPGHPSADEQGFRKDVIDLVKRLNMPIVRYPGGNFVSGYNWREGIGPKELRPRRLELAWFAMEPNQVGIDEFADWCKKVGTEAMVAVNLGTGTPKDAMDLVEYCNFPSGTTLSDLRIQNGHKDPHNFKVWCLGNEMDGPWQMCAKTADEYGRIATEAAKLMKWVDPSIELVACGSSGPAMATYPAWDRTVLEHTYDHVEYLSMHRYYAYRGDMDDFLASFNDLDAFISTNVAAADYVKALKRSSKTMMLSLDEWNTWYDTQNVNEEKKWTVGPEVGEQVYTLKDALCCGGLLTTMMNHADRLKMGCQAQLINALAAIMAKPGGNAYAQTIFYPFMHASIYGRGTAMQLRMDAPVQETKTNGEASYLAASVVLNEEENTLTLFALNRAAEQMELSMDLPGFVGAKPIWHTVMAGDMHAENTYENPEAVLPSNKAVDANLFEREGIIALPGYSWNVVRFQL